MSSWVARSVGGGTAANGTTTHTVTFTAAAAGNLLVAIVAGQVTSSTPSGWTLITSAVNFDGIYLWTKTASAGESSFTTTHNGDGTYPIAAMVYEFPAGSAMLGSAANGSATLSGGGTTVSGLSGNYTRMAASAHSGTTGFTDTVTWATPSIKDYDAVIGSANPIGLSVAYDDGQSGSSFSSNRSTSNSSGGNAEVLSWALSVTVSFSDPASTTTVTASTTASGVVTKPASAASTVTATPSATAQVSQAATASASVTATVSAAGSSTRAASATSTVTASTSASGTRSNVTVQLAEAELQLVYAFTYASGVVTSLRIPTPLASGRYRWEGQHQPYYVREHQDWAVEQEAIRHAQALFLVGEPVMFALMWKQEDYEAGLVDRCPRCRQDATSLTGRIQDVYQQPLTILCGYCFGTTFHGGVRARIVRPAILTDADEDERKGVRGVTHAEQLSIETTNDFRSRTGDYLFRRDGSRWQLGVPSRIMLRTGYQSPTQYNDAVGYVRLSAHREDASSVAFRIPPGDPYEIEQTLTSPQWWPTGTRQADPNTPYGSSAHDILNGPLIPSFPFAREAE